jgi:hypothetical protein
VSAGAQQPRAVPREELACHMLHGMAAAADSTTTRLALDSCRGCRDISPLFGPRPSNARMVSTAGAVTVGWGLLTHYAYHHGHENFARFLCAEAIGVHSTTAVFNGRNIH